MLNTSAAKKSKQRAECKSRVSTSPNQSLALEAEAEENAFEFWLQHELKYDAYHDLIFLGIGAFAVTGKLMSESVLSILLPPDEDGIGALKEFIWDVTRNDCRLINRGRNQFGL